MSEAWQSQPLWGAQPLEVGKDERAVAENRAAGRNAEPVLDKHRASVLESGIFVELLKNVFLSKTVLRRYSNALPCQVLVPERVISSIWPPALRPYSAFPTLVTMRYSSIESVFRAAL